MSKVMEDMRKEAVLQYKLDRAKSLLQEGELSIEEIAKIMEIPIEEIKELALAEA